MDLRVLKEGADLVASVNGEGFGESVLKFVSRFAIVRNFCVFYFSDLKHSKAVHTIWAGEVGDYWLRRHGVLIVNEPELTNPMLESVCAAPRSGCVLQRGKPCDGDPAKPLYDQFDVLERVTVASRNGRSGYQSFFLRNKKDGPFTDEEFTRLREILPFVHELIGLRHKLSGSEHYQFTADATVSNMRDRQVMGFSSLSKREAEVCDSLVVGLTVAGTALELGISESTVRTLRQRAYRKLKISSAAQITALIIHDAQHR